MNIKPPKITDAKPLLAVKGLRIVPVIFKNTGGPVTDCFVTPDLPLGFEIFVENKTCVLSGAPMRPFEKTRYTITVKNDEGESSAVIDIAVIEAPIKEQREAIMKVHDKRADLDTPRSQVENALGDQATMGSSIKPHEKFAHQPMGDDKRISQQVANNPDAENRARNNPELTPSPTQQLQAQAVNAMRQTMTPKPGA